MLTYGFYNSVEGDRKYDAVQLSSIFDGIIEDGGTVGQVLKKTSTGYAWGADKDTQPDLTPYAKTSDVNTKLDDKVDKVTGKGLSTNDYDSTAKAKVDAIGDPSEAPTVTDKSSVWSGIESVALGQLGGLKLVALSQSEYDGLATKDPGTLYLVKEG